MSSPSSAAVGSLAAMPARVLSPAEWPQVEALFGDVFGHVLPRALTQWKYAPSRGLSIGVADPAHPDRLVAHCGLMFREVLAFGQQVQAAQLTDLMVTARARGPMLRQGSPFAKVVGHALAQLGTAHNPRNADRLSFGFPSARAMRLAEHLGLVREIDQVHELVWTPAPGAVPELVEADSDRLRSDLDGLWADMRKDLTDALVGVRNADYFVPRYLHHPTRHYRVHLLRGTGGRPVAAFALRAEDGRFELADWVGSLAGVPALLDAARAATAAASCQALTTWITEGFLAVMSVGASRQHATEFRIICRGDLPADLWQRQHLRWWLTPGDTDYR